MPSSCRILTCLFTLLPFPFLAHSQLYPSANNSPGDTSHLYPYGPALGDSTVPKIDDSSSGPISISSSAPRFRFYDTLYNQLWVNTNGALSFGQEQKQFTPKSFPLNNSDIRMIAPFWSDVDTSNEHSLPESNIFYRQSVSGEDLERAQKDIRKEFRAVTFARFQPRWVFVATWHRVTFFGNVGTAASDRENTFQAVLISDATHSFVLFNYGEIQWTTGGANGGDRTTGLGGTPAQVGFDAGDHRNFHNVPGSRTSDIVNIRGRFSFRIDAQKVTTGGCQTHDQLSFSPRSGPYLGGKPITVRGPCFNAEDEMYLMVFSSRSGTRTQRTACDITEDVGVCVPEKFDDIGLRQLQIAIENPAPDLPTRVYRASYQILYNDASTSISYENAADLQYNTRTSSTPEATLLWDGEYFSDVITGADDEESGVVTFTVLKDDAGEEVAETFNVDSHVNLTSGRHVIQRDAIIRHGDVTHMEMDFYGAVTIKHHRSRRSVNSPIGATFWMKDLQKYAILRNLSGTHGGVDGGMLRVDVEGYMDEYVEQNGGGDAVGKVDYRRREEPVDWAYIRRTSTWLEQQMYNRTCHQWLAADRERFGDLSSYTLPPVPCNVEQAARDALYSVDLTCSAAETGDSNGEAAQECNHLYHEVYGITRCYHMAAPVIQHKPDQNMIYSDQIACYNTENGELLPTRGIGRRGAAHPSSGHPHTSHFYADILPYLQCCKLRSTDNDPTLCEMYQQRRPARMGCQHYQPPKPGWSSGDPHITTLDGVTYTFNGVGEFVVVQSTVNNFTMQARTEQFVNRKGVPVKASAWTAFALRQNGSSTVEVRQIGRGSGSQATTQREGGLMVLVDREEVDFEGFLDPQLDFYGCKVRNAQRSREVTVTFDGGAQVVVKQEAEVLAFMLYLPSNWKNTTSGLLGLWNDDPSDDLSPFSSLPPLAANCSAREVFEYAWTWSTTEQTSLFTYNNNDTFATYHHPEFLPILDITELDLVTDNSSQSALIEDVCGGDKQCMYDLLITGDEVIARYTATSHQQLVEVVLQLEAEIRCPYMASPEGGIINSTANMAGATIRFACNGGFTLVGEDTSTCMNTSLWSSAAPFCYNLTTVSFSDIVEQSAVNTQFGAERVSFLLQLYLTEQRNITSMKMDLETKLEQRFVSRETIRKFTVLSNEPMIAANSSTPIRIDLLLIVSVYLEYNNSVDHLVELSRSVDDAMLDLYNTTSDQLNATVYLYVIPADSNASATVPIKRLCKLFEIKNYCQGDEMCTYGYEDGWPQCRKCPGYFDVHKECVTIERDPPPSPARIAALVILLVLVILLAVAICVYCWLIRTNRRSSKYVQLINSCCMLLLTVFWRVAALCAALLRCLPCCTSDSKRAEKTKLDQENQQFLPPAVEPASADSEKLKAEKDEKDDQDRRSLVTSNMRYIDEDIDIADDVTKTAEC